MLIRIDCTFSWTFCTLELVLLTNIMNVLIVCLTICRLKLVWLMHFIKYSTGMNPGRTNETINVRTSLVSDPTKTKVCAPKSSLWPDQPWSSTPPSFLGGNPFNMSMSEYLNVGSQQTSEFSTQHSSNLSTTIHCPCCRWICFSNGGGWKC